MVRFEYEDTAIELTDEQYAKVIAYRIEHGQVFTDCRSDHVYITSEPYDDEFGSLPDEPIITVDWAEFTDGRRNMMHLDEVYTKLLNGQGGEGTCTHVTAHTADKP